MVERIPTFCGKDCGGTACPLVAVVDKGTVTSIERNPAGLDLKACPRGYALHNAHYAQDRILTPLIASGSRGSGSFREASWEEAITLVAHRLGDIRDRQGSTSLLALGSTGSIGALHNSENLLTRFIHASEGGTTLSSNYSNGAACFVLPYLFGEAHQHSGWDAATVRKSRLIILWGANVLEARLGTELGTEIAKAARTGVPVIVIDPRRSRTAKALNARWIPIRPGTDAAMMLAVLHVLFRDNLVDRARMNTLSVGADELERYVSGIADGLERSPTWAEGICGIPAGVIEGFAREYAATKPAMLVPGFSIQRVHNGEETFRLSVALQIATGNLGIAGGSSGSLNSRLPKPRAGSLPLLNSAASRSVPILRWADAILEGKAGGYPSDITAAYVMGFNAVNQGADSLKSIQALHALSFSVCHEMFMTPTARLCDVILPVYSPLEKEDICSPWLGNYILYKRSAVLPRGMVRNDYDILSELSELMGFGSVFNEGKSASDWLASFLAESEIPDTEAFKNSGVYFGANRERVGLEQFAADPGGQPLPTPSGKVELYSAAYARDTGRSAIPIWEDRPDHPRYAFLLITPKSIHRTHSQGGQLRGPDAGELSMARVDAARLMIESGDDVLVSNEEGRLIAKAIVSDDIAQGVLCLHEGSWLNIGPDGVDRGGCANMLTSTKGSGPSVAPVMHGIPVAVWRTDKA